MVIAQPHRLIDGVGVSAFGHEAFAVASDEEGAELLKMEQALEVEVGAVEDVEGARFRVNMSRRLTSWSFAVGDMDKAGDRATQVEQGVEFDGGFALFEPSPGEDGQTQVDGGGVERVDGVFEFEAEVIVAIERTSDTDKGLSEVSVDTPITSGVRIGEGVARDLGAKVHMVELGVLGSQAGLDIANALTLGELSESHAQVLVETGEAFDLVVTAVARDATAKRMEGEKVHHL